MIAEKYCRQPKPEKRNHWASQLLAGLKINKGKPKKTSPGQMAFPWAQWETPGSQVQQVAEKFVALHPLSVVNITEWLCHRLAHDHLPSVFLDNKYWTAGFGLILLFHSNQALS